MAASCSADGGPWAAISRSAALVDSIRCRRLSFCGEGCLRCGCAGGGGGGWLSLATGYCSPLGSGGGVTEMFGGKTGGLLRFGKGSMCPGMLGVCVGGLVVLLLLKELKTHKLQ
jgi:hypothetical protein